MILLNGQTLAAREWFEPESMSLSIEERNSTASMTLGPEAPEIRVNDWLRDDTEPGEGIVWRVKTVSESVETQTRTVSLEHVIAYLKDFAIFTAITPVTVTGNRSAKNCSARDAAAAVLAIQGVWRLGDVEATKNAPYNFDGDTVFAALETITGSLPDMQWEYDLTQLPFVLHIRKQPTGFQSEMRMRRNISTMRVQVDRTRTYTRIYPIGKNDLHISGNYLSKNEDVWGTICKIQTDQSKATVAELTAWAQDLLNRHCEPTVTVTVTGQDLSAATGEPLDHIVTGRRCRIPLPDYGTAMTERVTKMNWADKIKEPDRVTVTLANNLEDVASIVNSQAAGGSKSAKTAAAQKAEDHAWFEDTTTHVAMVAEAVAGPGAATNWSRVSQVIVDGQGIHQRVTKAEKDAVSMWAKIDVLEDRIVSEVANAKSDTYSKIEQTASKITSTVNAAKSSLYSRIMQTATNIYTQVGNAKSGLYSKIEQTASSIRSEVNTGKSTIFSAIMQTATNIYTQVGNAKSGLYSNIEQTAERIESSVSAAKSSLWSSIMQTATGISLKVGKGEVISSINQSAEQITINASRINLSGYVSANNLGTAIANITTLHTNTLYADVQLYYANGLSYTQGLWFLTLSLDGNTYTLKSTNMGGEETTVGTFSRATTLTGAWSSGKYTVTASPQGNKESTNIAMDPNGGSWSGGTYTRKVQYTSNGQNYYDTGITDYAYVNKSDISIPSAANWTHSSSDMGADVKVNLSKAYNYHKCTISVHGQTKTLQVRLTS